MYKVGSTKAQGKEPNNKGRKIKLQHVKCGHSAFINLISLTRVQKYKNLAVGPDHKNKAVQAIKHSYTQFPHVPNIIQLKN